MSIAAIERAYALDISPTEQRVLLVIAKHCDSDGHNGYPSVGLIAWMLGLKDRHVQRTLASLVTMKILTIVQEGGGRGRATHYFFDLTAGPVKTPFQAEYLRLKGGTDSTPFNGNGVIASTPFTDNQPVMTGLSVQTVSQPVHPLMETVSSDELNGVLPELKGVISDVKGDIAMSPESTLKNLKEPERESARASDVDSAGPSLSPASLDSFGITIYEEVFHRTLTPSERAYIVTNVSDAEQWRKVCQDWQVNRYKATNLTGLVDRYSRQGETLNLPGARPPVAAWDETSQRREPQPGDVPPDYIERARKLRAELDTNQDAGSPMIDQAALAALKARQASGVLKTMPPKRPFEWVQP